MLREFLVDRKFGLNKESTFVCRPNITNTFTPDKERGVIKAYTFLFWGNHGQRTNGNEDRIFFARKGLATVVINGQEQVIKKGERVVVPSGATWDIYALRGIFAYTVLLPENFDPLKVLGEKVSRSQLPHLESIPFAGPFRYNLRQKSRQ